MSNENVKVKKSKCKMTVQNEIIEYRDFEKVDVRVGCIVDVQDFPEARKPAYKLTIDFGSEVGEKKIIGTNYHALQKEELVGKQVIGVVNFPPRQIGPFMSEVLTLGVPDGKGSCTAHTNTRSTTRRKNVLGESINGVLVKDENIISFSKTYKF